LPVPVEEARRILNVPLGRRLVGFIGMGQGDLDIIMRAQQAIPDLWLMVIGLITPKVRVMAEEYGTADRLWQTGFVPDSEVGRFLSCAEVMVLPLTDRAANRGRLPNKILDYMAAGRPVVANPIGDIQAIIEQYRIGLLATESGFAGAIQRLLEDDNLREECGRNARHAAESHFAWPGLIDRLESFYAELLRSSRA
jgi:glycosyltransferase involved in cell wall biosynthesis